MKKIAFRWFDRGGFQILENLHSNGDGTFTLHNHLQNPRDREFPRDMTVSDVLLWARQENVKLIAGEA